jgi:hypothetical protein
MGGKQSAAVLAFASVLALASVGPPVNAYGQQLDGGDRSAAARRGAHEPIPDLIHDVEHAHPVAMMLLAKRLFDAGRRDEGVFWFYEAQLRWRSLLSQTSDNAERAQFQRIYEAVGPAINPHAFRDLPKFYAMVNSVLAWDAAHPDDFATDAAAKAHERAGLTDLVTYVRAHTDQLQSQTLETGDPSDPYSGNGGAMLSTPLELLTPYAPEQFKQFHVGSTTRDQVVQILGGPEYWSTDRDGTNTIGYSYAGSTLLGMTQIMSVTLSFDGHKVLTAVQLPQER